MSGFANSWIQSLDSRKQFIHEKNLICCLNLFSLSGDSHGYVSVEPGLFGVRLWQAKVRAAT